MIDKPHHQSSLYNYILFLKGLCKGFLIKSFFLHHRHIYICLVYAFWKPYVMLVRGLYMQKLIDFLIS